MQNYLDRDFALHHGAEVIRLFGLEVFLRLLGQPRKDLLEVVSDWYHSHGIAMPGRVGNAYRLSALLEFRVARIYGRMAEAFDAIAPARALFRDLQAEEIQHGRVMTLCLYTVRQSEALRAVPGVRDPEVRRTLRMLRELERQVARMSLDEALDLTLKLEASEVNVIFSQLLAQVDAPQSRFIAERLEHAGEHRFTVPPRVERLHAQLHHRAA